MNKTLIAQPLHKAWIAVGAAMALCACSNQGATDGYVVTGTAEGTTDGDTVYLAVMQGFFGLAPVDTAIVSDGEFKFTGSYDGAALRVVVPMHYGMPTGMGAFILENAPINITLYAGSDVDPVVEGGPSQALYEEFATAETEYEALMEGPWAIVNDSTLNMAARDAAQATLDSLQEAAVQRHYDFIMNHIPSPMSDMLLGYFFQEMSEEQLDSVLDKMEKADVQYVIYKELAAERKASASTAIGQPYTDLEMENPDGRMIKISDYVGKYKYVLIDFWASWCGPCRAEMPNIVRAYASYHDMGLEVVGVSLDQNREDWVAAIEKLDMPWPQMSDLAGWQSVGAQVYGVRAIPSNILVDQDGKIVDKDLRGDYLSERLAELLDK